MTRPYSNDLRDRAVSANIAGETTRVVAARFGVVVSSVVKWQLRYRASGSAAPGKIDILPNVVIASGCVRTPSDFKLVVTDSNLVVIGARHQGGGCIKYLHMWPPTRNLVQVLIGELHGFLLVRHSDLLCVLGLHGSNFPPTQTEIAIELRICKIFRWIL